MITYGKRFLNKTTQKAVESRTETKDAVIVDIDRTTSTCRVKVQGSDKHVVAYFSELRSMSPTWLKPGAAVRIAHRGGVRGYVDVVGAGQTIPTGVGSTQPSDPILLDDAVLSGCALMLPPSSRDAFGADRGIIWVTTGSYRINNSVKSLPTIKCRKSNPLKMRTRPVIGQIAAQIVVDRPSTGNYLAGRVLLNKTTGEITCQTKSGSNPATPVCPGTCLDLGCFLYSYNNAEFNECCLNIEYQKPVPLYFTITSPIVIDYETDKIPITIEVKDQYGKSIAGTPGWSVNITLAAGTGALSEDEATTRKSIYTLFEGLQYTFYYHRNKTAVEKPPMIKISVAEVIGAEEYQLFLLDEAGQIIE